MKRKITNKKWSERFSSPVAEIVKKFNASVHFDNALAPYDILLSIAHVEMLQECAIISIQDKKKIVSGLKKIQREIANNKFNWNIEDEDVHLNIESRLIELIGDVGKKLHTARSRNDQVATGFRLYLKDKSLNILELLTKVQTAILKVAEINTNTLMVGYTHLQVAQPISFGHHLLAYFQMLERDYSRLMNCIETIDHMPLGSAALAGTSFPINRESVAKKLGFKNICRNSIDAVSDRDFAIEFNSFASILMLHLSRFCEEIIFWMNPNNNFVTISDSFCTGSSIMPQKKNPDIPELIRGKTGRVYGNLISLLTLMKSQPLAYNKDNQEDKEPVFDSVQTISTTLEILSQLIPTISVNKESMLNSLEKGFPTATDLADFLVKKGEPFRSAHGIVSKLVRIAEENNIKLHEIPEEKLRKIKHIDSTIIKKIMSLDSSVSSRNHTGGTSPKQVKKEIGIAKKIIKNKKKLKK